MSLPELTPEERSRYARHLTLSEVGEAGQRRIKGGRILVVGAGGLGSPCLLYLAAAGVGHLGIVEFDRVEASNLQRQVLHGTSGLGTPKADSAAARLADLNPGVQVTVHPERLDRHNALAIMADYDVIIDGSDNFPTRYLINDACELLGKPFVYGAIQRFEGQISVFNHQGGPTYRDLFPEPPPPDLAPNCAEAGVLGVLPGVIGTLQATEALKILLGAGQTLSGRLLLYDALAMRFDALGLARDPGRTAVTELVDYEALCAAPVGPPPAWSTIDAPTAAMRLASGWRPFVLDVRTAAEASIAQIPGTHTLVPHREVDQHASELPAQGDVLVYCRLGGRSAQACDALVAAGVDPGRLFNLDGGIIGWIDQVDGSLPRP